VDLASVIPFFMEEHIRTVHKDFSDVQVHSFFYKVDPKLRGDKLLVRFDPYGDKQSVLLYSLTGQYLAKALRHDREKVTQLPPKPPSATLKDSFIELIVTEHDKALQARAKQPSFPKLPSGLSFQDLAKTVAHLLGLQGGLTAFSLNQLEHIQKTYQACPDLNKALVKRAFETAPQPSLLSVLYALKTLAKRKES
jgi:putative transposase